MRATAHRPASGAPVELRLEGFITSSGQPLGEGGGQEPSPEELLAASLASCTATTMELYARRKGWAVEQVEVDADCTPAQRGSPTRCTIVVRLPENLAPDRRDRLMQIGATSRVHRILEGEIVFDERVELTPVPTADRADPTSQPRRKHIALLNGLHPARPGRPG